MWPNPQETGDLVTFTEEILMENFTFSAVCEKQGIFYQALCQEELFLIFLG